MGKLKLQWSTIQLKMVNRQKILPLGRLSDFIVGIDGVRTTTDIEIIEIVDDRNPYTLLLGLDWEFSNIGIINLPCGPLWKENNNWENVGLRYILFGPYIRLGRPTYGFVHGFRTWFRT